MRNAKGLATLGFVAALFALILTPMLFDAGSVRAQGAIPANYYGGGPVGLTEGDVVVASIGDSECGSSTADADGAWHIPVWPGDCGGAAVDGAMVTFTINGDPAAESVAFEAGWGPDDPAFGFQLTLWVAPPPEATPEATPAMPEATPEATPAMPEATPEATPAMPEPPAPPSLSRSSGLAIFSGGSVQQLEAAALAACPGGATLWVNEPHGEGYLPFVPNPEFDIANAPFMSAYGDGFDGPEAVIVQTCIDGMDGMEDSMGDNGMEDSMGDDGMEDSMGDNGMES